MRIKIKSKRGQAMILTLVFMTVILGMAAAVVDVGAWYRTHRQMQNNADAAALAGAALPESTGQASSLAVTYADRNGGGVTGSDVVISSREVANDQIQVTARKAVPGVFAKLFGLDSVTVRAHATALAAPPAQPKWAAPFAVDVMHPMLQCEPLPCFNQATELDLDKVGPGASSITAIAPPRRARAALSASTAASASSSVAIRPAPSHPTPARSSTPAMCATRSTTGSGPTSCSRSIGTCATRVPASTTKSSAGSAST
jgi:hypothetical protein